MKINQDSIAGYNVSTGFNGTRMWKSSDPKVRRCPECKFRLDFLSTNQEYTFKKSFNPKVAGVGPSVSTTAPLSYTYDICAIASAGFKEFCDAQGYQGLEFAPFSNDYSHFHLISHNIIRIDAEKSKLRFGKRCPTCHNYAYTVFRNPPVCYALQGEYPGDGIYRSDVLFADGDDKHPLMIIGPETKEKFKTAGFKKLAYHVVYRSEEAIAID